MRVLHLTTEFPPIIYGGLGTAVGGLVAASSHAGIETSVLLVGAGSDPAYRQSALTSAGAAAEPDIQPAAGVHLHPVSHADAERYALGLISDWRPDVLHLHVFWLWPLAKALCARTGLGLVYTVHSLDRAEYELGQGPSECLGQWETQADLIASADLIVALTRSERDLLIEYCPQVTDRIRVVGNGIEDTVRARMAAWRRESTDVPMILFTGRFVERKGIRELLDAAALVLKERPAARFVLAGGHRHCDGVTMARYWMPEDLWVHRDRIHFTGWLSPEELADWYQRADILAVPSWYEPFGMVVLEGMLYGLPIVASNIGGPAEILEHECTGLLVPPRDSVRLALDIVRLIDGPQLRRRLGLTAAQVVRQEWSYSRIVQKMSAVYIESVARRPGPVRQPLSGQRRPSAVFCDLPAATE
jgi:glycogen(starch) synthase